MLQPYLYLHTEERTKAVFSHLVFLQTPVGIGEALVDLTQQICGYTPNHIFWVLSRGLISTLIPLI